MCSAFPHFHGSGSHCWKSLDEGDSSRFHRTPKTMQIRPGFRLYCVCRQRPPEPHTLATAIHTPSCRLPPVPSPGILAHLRIFAGLLKRGGPFPHCLSGQHALVAVSLPARFSGNSLASVTASSCPCQREGQTCVSFHSRSKVTLPLHSLSSQMASSSMVVGLLGGTPGWNSMELSLGLF